MCGISTGEKQTKIRLVPIDKLHAVEAQIFKKDKLVQRMAKLLKIGVKEAAMPDAWTQKALSLIDQAEGVKG
ncbi:hypothetical protein [Desulfovibrio sp. UCD-KL4C]|uniref:hypothetical protein n=1 Tax=Desulfovibrio sp. UCD-KL4C TaxID=2578120 RepID=UPI0025C3E2CB|nr:hypothetical protein [Desulfovibrio sp. UCD-KL4C]